MLVGGGLAQLGDHVLTVRGLVFVQLERAEGLRNWVLRGVSGAGLEGFLLLSEWGLRLSINLLHLPLF